MGQMPVIAPSTSRRISHGVMTACESDKQQIPEAAEHLHIKAKQSVLGTAKTYQRVVLHVYTLTLSTIC